MAGSVAFAPTLPIAVALLLARTCLSQFGVPARQARVMTVVTPDERTTAAPVTSVAGYTVLAIGAAAGRRGA